MLIGILGNIGSYKTTLATAFAREASLHGTPVFSNYNINFPHCHKLDLSDILQLDINRGMIIVDEVYTIAESRTSMSKVNRFFSYFVFQTRKLHVDVVYTAQLASSVDLRLFDLSPILIGCHGLDEKTGLIDYTFNVEGAKTRISIPLPFFEKEIFPYFDTFEVVDPMGMAELLVEIEKYDKEKINKRVDDAVKTVQEFANFDNPRLVAKYLVDDIMLRLGLPLSISAYVTNRIKSNIVQSRKEAKKPIPSAKTGQPNTTIKGSLLNRE